MTKYNNRKTGEIYEKRAAEYLESMGLFVLEKNFRCRFGEIDIICKDGNTYVFVEVKYRKNSKYGLPEEAVTYSKQKTICKVAMFYSLIKKLPQNGSYRFDVVTILDDEIKWYKNAFMFIN